MKKSRMYAAVVALLVLALSLFSIPVTSAEHPWDSDDGDEGVGVAPGDSGQVTDPAPSRAMYSTATGKGWFTTLTSTISAQLTASFRTIQSSLTKSGTSTSSSGNTSTRRFVRTNSPSE
jgi:hypothetical protein